MLCEIDSAKNIMNKNWLLKSLAIAIVIGSMQAMTASTEAAMPQRKKRTDTKQAPAKQEAAQKKQVKKKESKLATIRGSLDLESKIISEIDWDTVNGTLGQLVALRQPQLPDSWKEMTPEKRIEWNAKFSETEKGKKLLADNQKALADRHMQDFNIRSKGKFIIYDVPQGRFEMRIVGQKIIDEKTYVLQAYGQFEVGEVDELDFSNMKIDVLRLVKMGEEAPEVSGKSVDGKPLSLSSMRGKHVLMAFGMTGNPAFEFTTRSLKEVASIENAVKVQLLTVTVDEDLTAVAAFNKKMGVDWTCLNLGEWDQETLNSYGLKSVPSLWLIDAEGKVVLTGSQFIFELNRTKFPVAKLVDETIAGRLVIGGEKEDGPTPTEACQEKTDGQSDDKAPGKR